MSYAIKISKKKLLPLRVNVNVRFTHCIEMFMNQKLELYVYVLKDFLEEYLTFIHSYYLLIFPHYL